MKTFLLLWLLAGLLAHAAPAASEVRIWRSSRGMRIRAVFEKYEGGQVTLRRPDDRRVDIRFEELSPGDREEVIRLAGEDATGTIPAGQMEKPGGRRDAVWKPLVAGSDLWPAQLKPEERKALLDLNSSWRHVETEYFVLHYQQEAYARTLGRMADFFYEYIAADLRGFTDQMSGKSHIVVMRNGKEWKKFMDAAGTAPEWAAAFVYGPIMFVQDTGKGRGNADVVGHEMTHLVLNRFITRPLPLWLNEGFAEWYGKMAWDAFRGQSVRHHRQFRGSLSRTMPLKELMAVTAYPADVALFYETSRYLVGYLQLKRDTRDFVAFLRRVAVGGEDPMAAISTVYGHADLAELERAFLDFAR